jgi:hypothetical protein
MESKMLAAGSLAAHHLAFRRRHADAAGDQGLDRFGIDLDAGKEPRLDPDAGGVPEAASGIDQAVVGRSDVDVDENLAGVGGQLRAGDPADLDLAVVDRRTLVERTQPVGFEYQVETGEGPADDRRAVQRRKVVDRFPGAGLDIDVRALDQGVEIFDPGQADFRLDQPELGAGGEQPSLPLVDKGLADDPLAFCHRGREFNLADMADGDALVADIEIVAQSVGVVETDRDNLLVDVMGFVVVLIEDVFRTVDGGLAGGWREKGDAAGEDAFDRTGFQLDPGKSAPDGNPADIVKE